jgi:hypothetical protein
MHGMSDQLTCHICKAATSYIFTAKVRSKHDVKYYQCPNCGYVQVETPYWLDEAYASPINLTDTGIIFRNLMQREQISLMLYSLFPGDSQFLDYSGGYGIFTRLMRDVGFDYYWNDPYTQNLVARGFEAVDGQKYAAATAFEVFEHLTDPHMELQKILEWSDTVIFSTSLVSVPAPASADWWYYGLEHGQHVSLYTAKALELLGKQYGLELYTTGSDLHVLTKSQLLPKAISQQVLDVALAEVKTDAVASELLKKAYAKVAAPAGLSPKAIARKLVHNYRLRDLRILNSELNIEERLKLTSIFAKPAVKSALFSFLLASGGQYYKFVTSQIKGKTFDDMLEMRQRMYDLQK